MKKLFSKSPGKTDIERRLTVPSKCLTLLPCFGRGHAVDIQAEDEHGHMWIFGCTIRKKGYYFKPVLSKGWLKFVIANDLKISDKVEFYKKSDGAIEAKYKIKVKKSIKIVGVILGYVPIESTAAFN